MFNKLFNIIQGDRASGKTFLIWDISKILKGEGYKICFIGCTDELEGDNQFLQHFDFKRFIYRNSRSNGQIIDLIKEIVKRDKYDYLFIDDIDCLEPIDVNRIKSIDIKKIISCREIPVIGFEFDHFEVASDYSDDELSSRTSVRYKKNTYDKEGFLSSISRDFKIKKVLKNE